MPDGVFNVVHGDKVAVDALLEHPDVAAISFVGSTPVAKYIYATATSHGKRCQALARREEPHGRAAGRRHRHGGRRAVSAGYGSAGERCMAISMVVAVGDAAEPLVDGDQGAHPEGQGRRRRRAAASRWGR